MSSCVMMVRFDADDGERLVQGADAGHLCEQVGEWPVPDAAVVPARADDLVADGVPVLDVRQVLRGRRRSPRPWSPSP